MGVPGRRLPPRHTVMSVCNQTTQMQQQMTLTQQMTGWSQQPPAMGGMPVLMMGGATPQQQPAMGEDSDLEAPTYTPRKCLGLSPRVQIVRVLDCVAEELQHAGKMPTGDRVVTLLGGGYSRQHVNDGLQRARAIFKDQQSKHGEDDTPPVTRLKASIRIIKQSEEISAVEREAVQKLLKPVSPPLQKTLVLKPVAKKGRKEGMTANTK